MVLVTHQFIRKIILFCIFNLQFSKISKNWKIFFCKIFFEKKFFFGKKTLLCKKIRVKFSFLQKKVSWNFFQKSKIFFSNIDFFYEKVVFFTFSKRLRRLENAPKVVLVLQKPLQVFGPPLGLGPLYNISGTILNQKLRKLA